MTWSGASSGEHFVASNPPNTFAWSGAPSGSFNNEVWAPPPSGGDDSAAIQAALNSCFVSGNPYTRSLRLAPGVYKLATGLTRTSRAAIKGSGIGVTVLQATAAINMLTLDTGDIDTSLEDMSFDGNSLANRGIYAINNGAIQLHMTNVEVYGCTGTPGAGWDSVGNNAYSMPWLGCKFNNNKIGVRAVGIASGSPDHNYLVGCQIYYNSVTNLILGDGVYVLNDWTFLGGDLEITPATGPIDNMLIKGVQPLNLFGTYFECAGNAGNHDIHLASTVPSIVNITGYETAGGSQVTNPIVIDAGCDNSVIVLGPHQTHGIVGATILDSSANSRVKMAPGIVGGAVTDETIVGNAGILKGGTGGFDWRSPGGAFIINYNNGNQGAFVYYGGAGSPLLATDGIGSGILATYKGLATQGLGVPAIYQAPALFTGQTAAKNPVATLTSPNDGAKHVYEISGTVTITTLGSGAINLEVTYTDDNGTARTCIIPVCAEAGAFAAVANTADAWKGQITIAVNPNTAVTILTAGTFTGCTYNVSGQIKQVL